MDVRRFPGSRRNPQYNEGLLSKSLEENGIGYIHMEDLGGHRQTSPESINTGWENLSFRGYADYMQTTEFAQALERLAEIARAKATVIMCAEAVPWRCHRSLISDALLAHGFEVVDIYDEKSSRPHRITPWARVEGERVTYPKATETGSP